MPGLQPTIGQTLAALGAVLSVTLAPVLARAAVEKVHWSGTSGGYRWRFTDRDITAAKSRQPALSLRKRLYPNGQDMEGLTFYASQATPLSLVGSVLSFREDVYWEGGAHPSGAIRYTTVDASRPTRRLQLTDFFPDAHVRDALWGDKVVKSTLAKNGITRKPATAAALVKALTWKTFGGEEGGTYQFSDDLLSRFCFHHMEGRRVAVRLNVSWGYEIYRFQSTEIGILLPIPARLQAALQRASAGREGFLARAVRKRFEEKSATLIERGGKG